MEYDTVLFFIFDFQTLFAGLKLEIKPVFLQTYTANLSARSIKLSFKNNEQPCAKMASRSISPILNPPSLALPPAGCLVKRILGPIALEWTLSLTICLNLE